MNDMSHFPLPPGPAAGDAAERAAMMNDILAEQARALDAVFTRLLGHADENMTSWPIAAEAYARLAFQAQWNCRASLEAMARLIRSEAEASRREARADRLAAPHKGDGQ